MDVRSGCVAPRRSGGLTSRKCVRRRGLIAQRHLRRRGSGITAARSGHRCQRRSGRRQCPGRQPGVDHIRGIGIVGLPLALGVLTWILPRRQVRQLAVVTPVLFLLGMMLFPLGMTTDTLIGNATPWYQGIHALHGMILATAWQHRGV